VLDRCACPNVDRRTWLYEGIYEKRYSMIERPCVAPFLSIITWSPEEPGRPLSGCHSQVRGWLGARGIFMLSLGLRARCTPSLLALAPSYVSFSRHLTRWPPRRSRISPPHPLRSDVIGGPRSFAVYSIAIAFGAGVGFIAYENYQPFRHTVLAVVRCSRVASE
jgi:hypothetical protein